jgi:hypothetical protein
MVFFVIHTFHYLTHSQSHIVTVNSDNFIISGSSLKIFYGRHHDLLECYDISISQITMDLFLFLSSITHKTFTALDYIYE